MITYTAQHCHMCTCIKHIDELRRIGRARYIFIMCWMWLAPLDVVINYLLTLPIPKSASSLLHGALPFVWIVLICVNVSQTHKLQTVVHCIIHKDGAEKRWQPVQTDGEHVLQNPHCSNFILALHLPNWKLAIAWMVTPKFWERQTSAGRKP